MNPVLTLQRMTNVSVGDGPLGAWREKQGAYEAKLDELSKATRALLDANQVEAKAKANLDVLMRNSKSSDADILAAKVAWQAARAVAGRAQASHNSLDPEVHNLRSQLDSAKTAFINA